MVPIYVVVAFFFTVIATGAELITSRVLKLNDSEGSSVIIEITDRMSIDVGTGVTLLREGPPIIHPISGEVLGVPHEPVGYGDVRLIGKLGATVMLSKVFSKPELGDVAEYEIVSPTTKTEEDIQSKNITKIVDLVNGLEETVKNYAKSQNTESTDPVFVKEVWDEISSLRSYLVSIDERLIKHELSQQEDQRRNIQVAVDDMRKESSRELILRYDEDTEIKLEVAGNTLHLSVLHDSLVFNEVATVELDDLSEEIGMIKIDEINSETTWFSDLLDVLGSTYVLAGILIAILVVVMILYFIKKNNEGYDEVVDDFGEDYEDLFDDDDYSLTQELESRDK